MNILILSPIIPCSPIHGGSLRTLNLSRELARQHKVALLALGGAQQDLNELQSKDIYNGISLMKEPGQSEKKLSWLRHWRLSDRDYYKSTRRKYYQAVVDRLHEIIEQDNIDLVIAVTLQMSEYIRDLMGVKRVVDDFDCNTLTIERELAAGNVALLSGRLRKQLLLIRTKEYEGTLVKDFDGVMTISPIDREALAKLNGVPLASIELIPNGVSNELLSREKNIGHPRRDIAFWGNLDFPPNRSAVEYFFRSIFRPYLSHEGVHWYLIGEAKTWSPELLIGDDPNITITGYVDDLYSLIEDIPIMVNPMAMGSGLKNKVLEAFMLRCGVVSTSLGVESIGVENGIHCVIRDDPEAFATAVLELLHDPERNDRLATNGAELIRNNYTWAKVGEHFVSYLEKILSSR